MTNTQTTHTRTADFDPANYRLVAVFDNHDEVAGYVDAADEFITGYSTYRGTVNVTDAFDERIQAVERTCVHCGRRFGFMIDCYFEYLPTGEYVFVGSGCANDLGLADKLAYATKRAAAALANAKQRAEVARKRAEWTAANPEAAAALDAYEADVEAGGEVDTFLDDLSRARRNYGALTEKQTPWCVKALAKRAEWAAKKAAQAAALANAPALEAGRRELTGVIVSTKTVENDFGGAFKMLVELPDGNRVFGTVPRKLEDWVLAPRPFDAPTRELVGTTVRFTAAVEVSNDDEHFGFYSRPTKAEVI